MVNDPSHALIGTAYLRIGNDAHSPLPVRAYRVEGSRDGEHHHVAAIDLDPFTPQYNIAWECVVEEKDKLRIVHTPFEDHAGGIWFVRMDVSRTMGQGRWAISAFATEHFPHGTIIDEMAFVMLPVHNDDQIGAVVWNRANAEIEQIYVAPHVRRNNSGRLLLYAAAAVHHAYNGPGRLHAPGKRTDLGQKFVEGWHNQLRIGPHTELSPPMDPQQR